MCAAALHALWNLILKASGDRLVTAAMQSTAGAVVLLPALLSGGYPSSLWPWLAASGLLHLVYGLTLVRAYELGDLSVVYPIARGSAPLLVAVGAALLLKDSLSMPAMAGVVLITGGVLAVAHGRRLGAAWALVCGCSIAAYTLVDGSAVREEGGSLRYTAALFLTNALTLTAAALWRRRGAAFRLALTRSSIGGYLVGGVASAAAYLLVLIAARSAPLGAVSAVRETSVVLGALAGWLILKEPFGRARVAASVVIAFGAVLLVA